MKTANELLGLNYSVLSGSGLNTRSLQYHFDRQIKGLQKLAEKIDANTAEIPDGIDADFLVNKFYTALSHRNYESLSRKELRHLSYLVIMEQENHRSIVSNDKAFSFYLELCEIHWSNILLNSLVFLLFRIWNQPQQESVDTLRLTILKYLNMYNGKRKHLVFLKENPQFVHNKSGPIKLAGFCSKYYLEVSSLVLYMQLGTSWLTLGYFEDAIVIFLDNTIKLENPDWEQSLQFILNLGLSSDVKKRVLARFILAENLMQNDRNRRVVRQWAIQYIGKPKNTAAWKLDNNAAMPSEKELLEKARRQVLAWVARGVIEFFFEKCINEPRRRNFWLQYAQEISDVNVYVSNYTKQSLKTDTRFKDLLDDYFTIVNNTSDAAAIIMHVKNYVLIEFSDTGNAFFAIRAKNYFINNRISKVEDLKPVNVPILLRRDRTYIFDIQDEGRLSHHDGVLNWEEYFAKWIGTKVGVYV
ncbi:MAG: hypothetical protein LAT67_08940 [Balneolales bacterium]|nr:hypothetical protein [Balneolales bacterium]